MSDTGPVQPISLDRPASSWPAWVVGLVMALVLVVQLAAGVSAYAFTTRMASVERVLTKLSSRIQTNSEQLQRTQVVLAGRALLVRRLDDLEGARKDHEARLRALEYSRRKK